MRFANTLRLLAQRRGLSVHYLAEFTGLDPSFVRRLMTGEKHPGDETVLLLALALVSCPERYRKEKEGMVNTLSTLWTALMEDAADTVTRRR